jgi:hypothetical protein
MSNWNGNIVVNIFSTAPGVDRQSFGSVLHATESVGAGFTEKYRVYSSNTEVQNDSDLLTAAQAAGAAYFSQPNHPPQLVIAKVSYAAPATALDLLRPEYDDWYGVDMDDRTEANLIALATWAEANDKFCIVQSSDAAITAGTGGNLFEDLQTAARVRTGGIWHATDTEHAALAWLANKLAVDPDSQTTNWAYARLSGVAADSLTSTERNTVTGLDGNLYLPFYGVPAAYPGKMFDSGWMDELVTKDWFKARTQEGIAQLLLDISSLGQKVPYTNEGLAMIESVVRGVQGRGENVGHFRPGESTVTVPDINDVDAADILARHATIEASSVLAGAIQTVTLNIGILAS